MDSLVRRFDAVRDVDLMLCEHRGIAYQREMQHKAQYDAAYLSKIKAYDKGIAAAVNAGRVALMKKHLPVGATVLDIGAGDQSFMRAAQVAGYKVKGFDVIMETVVALQRDGLYAEDPHEFEAITLWDTVEHMESPERVLRNIKKDTVVFISVPVFEDLRKIRASKHYRPGEHLYYWTSDGFVQWMAMREFRLLEVSMHEIEAGRECIAAYAFKRDLPTFRDYVSAYNEMHSTRHYGDSATDEYLEIVAPIVNERNPSSILDFGCGRSDVIAHFWNEGKRKLARYDPAIGKYKLMPEGRFDLLLCLDVMEHIPISRVDHILSELRAKGDVCIFAISTIKARAKLPNGENAHCTILTKDEWRRWIIECFGGLHRTLPSKHPHELVLLAGAG